MPVGAEMAARRPEQGHNGKKEASSKSGFEEPPLILRSEAVFLEAFTPITAKASRSAPKAGFLFLEVL